MCVEPDRVTNSHQIGTCRGDSNWKQQTWKSQLDMVHILGVQLFENNFVKVRA